MKIDDIKYICTNLSNLAGIPVRLYEGNNQIYYCSIVDLLKDPFEIDTGQVLKLNDAVSYYQNPFYYYYGIINLEELKIIAGPTRQFSISKQELRSIAFALGIPKSSTDDFMAQIESLSSIPLMTLLQILCMIYFSITGEKKTLESIAIHESEQINIINEMGRNVAARTAANLEEQMSTPYNAMDTENRLMDMVMRGDVAALNEFISNAPAVRAGNIALEQLRQSKNIFIVTITLVSRAAIRGGMDVTSSLALSDAYIQKCELADTPDKITDLSYRMVLDYAEKVAKIRVGLNPSVLAIKVSKYIQQHLSDPIKVADIAKALFMGRSRLSTNFKNETGINLSSHIMSQKIDEAKRLIRYSDKPFASISLYLGFYSQSHFSKVFKKYTDNTPFEYRQLHKHY